MASKVTSPRGMRDVIPAEKARRGGRLPVIRGSHRAHCFDDIETPVVENSDRLHARLAGDHDKFAFGVLSAGSPTTTSRRRPNEVRAAEALVRTD